MPDYQMIQIKLIKLLSPPGIYWFLETIDRDNNLTALSQRNCLSSAKRITHTKLKAPLMLLTSLRENYRAPLLGQNAVRSGAKFPQTSLRAKTNRIEQKSGQTLIVFTWSDKSSEHVITNKNTSISEQTRHQRRFENMNSCSNIAN